VYIPFEDDLLETADGNTNNRNAFTSHTHVQNADANECFVLKVQRMFLKKKKKTTRRLSLNNERGITAVISARSKMMRKNSSKSDNTHELMPK
jgi:hypothetical protein